MKIAAFEIPNPIITKEHGSWAVLLVPIFVSLFVAGRWNPALVLLVLSALSFFLAYVPAQMILRRVIAGGRPNEKEHQARFWAASYIVVGSLSGVMLLFRWPLLLVVGILGVASFFANFFLVRRYAKSIATDVVAVAGLTLTGPASYYLLTGKMDHFAALLYLLDLLFFCSSVFYVHMKISAASVKNVPLDLRERMKLGSMNLVYLGLLVLVLFVLAINRLFPVAVLAAFVPMIAHGLYGTVMLSGKVRFKNLGFLLLAQSIVFAILIPLFVS